MKKIAQFIFVPILILGASCLISCEKKGSGLPVDGDGNEYDTVVIGTQVWLKENLKTTKFITDVSLKLVTDNSQWDQESNPGYCWYDNKSGYKDTYGALYNWRAVSIKTLCPEGWHISTIEEWETLINYLGGEEVAGGKLKEAGFTHWGNSNTGATNETGFTALPGGNRNWDGTFSSVGNSGVWFAFSPIYNGYALFHINSQYTEISNLRIPKEGGFSVRCVKDNW